MSINLEKDIVDLIRGKGHTNTYIMSNDVDYNSIANGKTYIVFVTSANTSSDAMNITNKTTMFTDNYCTIACLVIGTTIETVEDIESSIKTLMKHNDGSKFGFTSSREDANCYFDTISSSSFAFNDIIRKTFNMNNSKLVSIRLRYLK